MKKIILTFALFLLSIHQTTFAQEKVHKSDAEWKKELTQEQYYILRQKGTEYAFSGEYNKHYKKGVYHCAGCKTPLFKSENKFDSGTGWPSFDRHINSNVGFLEDRKYGMVRTEIICNVCDGHLGHVFPDGPRETTGKRYCVNSASLTFKNAESKK